VVRERAGPLISAAGPLQDRWMLHLRQHRKVRAQEHHKALLLVVRVIDFFKGILYFLLTRARNANIGSSGSATAAQFS